ncbi:DUF2281 domain-containing protein [Spirosoma areae]
MYTSISGLFENGQLTLLERAPTSKKSKVVITFLEEIDAVDPAPSKPVKRRLGGLEGKITIPDDFNEPLDDLTEYMH